jgi:drug/metabolite transporter (DMT)-like permease
MTVDLLTVALMLLAAVLHAAWHSLVKSSDDPIVSLAGMGLVASIPALALLPFVGMPATGTWWVLIVSTGLHVTYKLCLSSAYARGDLGEAFPLARGGVPLFALAIAYAALGQVPTAPQWLAIGAISAGLMLIVAERLRQNLSLPLLTAAAFAALAVASYSVLDAYGMQVAGSWIVFTAWLIVLDNMTFLLVSRHRRGSALWAAMWVMRGRIVVSGLLGLLSFSVFLWALSRSPVATVSALRETSVLFAILIGALLHKERFSGQRMAAGVLIVLGIGVIAAYR